jgi:hypothetical protein
VIEAYVRTNHFLETDRSVAVPLIERFFGEFDRSTVEASARKGMNAARGNYDDPGMMPGLAG